MMSRREEQEERAWGKLYAQMDKNKIQREIRQVESILSGPLGAITASEAGEARQALKHLIGRKTRDLHRIIAQEAELAREDTRKIYGG